jgi:hypothetical protein
LQPGKSVKGLLLFGIQILRQRVYFAFQLLYPAIVVVRNYQIFGKCPDAQTDHNACNNILHDCAAPI